MEPPQSHPFSHTDWRKPPDKIGRGIGSYEQVPPQKQTVGLPPAGSLSHGCAVPAPSRRELWGAYLSTWVCAYGKCLLWNPSGKNQRFLPAPFSKGAFGCGIDTGRVREVTIRRKPPCAMTAAARRPFDKGAFLPSVSLPSGKGSENSCTMH